MYRCQICRAVSQPHEPRKVHTVYREVPAPHGGTREEIAREIPVCAGCQSCLNNDGKTLEELLKNHVHGRPILETAIPVLVAGERIKKASAERFVKAAPPPPKRVELF